MNKNVLDEIEYFFIWKIWIDFECEISGIDWLFDFLFLLLV